MPQLDWLYRFMPQPNARNRPSFEPERISNVLVFRAGPNASYSYYLENRLKNLQIPFRVSDSSNPPPDTAAEGAFVILCRYAMLRQIWWLIRNRKQMSGLALFIDDGMADTIIEGQCALHYRFYLLWCGLLPLLLLNRWMTHIWVSTEPLRTRLDATDILPPLPSQRQLRHIEGKEGQLQRVRLAYHATGSHDGEHQFLMPIVAELMKRFGQVEFELIASKQAGRVWRKTLHDVRDRVCIFQKMEWRSYFEHTLESRNDVVLVPLLSSRVNDLRADTKRIDICRMGAAAVFSASTVYERCSQPDDILLDNDPSLWLETVSRLLVDADFRNKSKLANMDSAMRMMHQSKSFLPGLEDFMVTSEVEEIVKIS